MVYYLCRYCKSEIGKLPIEQAMATIRYIQKMNHLKTKETFLTYEQNGDISVQTICEQCEETYAENPHYYALEHWLQ